MWQGMRRRMLAGIVAIAGAAALAPAASAAINPSLTVTTPTTAATAGSTGTLGLDINLNPSSGSEPDNVTLNLPPGVLADASLDNGACIKTPISDFSNDAACQLGSGTVTSLAAGYIPVQLPVDFYLTPPPVAGELGGLAVATGQGDQVGAIDGISIRPTGSADGVGVTLDLTLPNNIDGEPVAVSEIDSTFTGVRFPATCPSTPASFTMSADTYQSTSAATTTAPLPVTGCGSLPYDPQYSLTAARDAHDKVVALTTTITQAADESPNSGVSLAFPMNSLSPSIASLHQLCTAGPASGSCTPVGSVTASSPDYPTPLVGQAYLTGNLGSLTLTLVFPSPFPLTLVGTVDLKTNVTTFTGLPDIPLTSLVVALNGGTSGLFDTNCAVPTNTSTATLTDQSGTQHAATAKFTIANCPSSSTSTSSSGTSPSSGSAAVAHVTTTQLRGLTTGKPSLRFTLAAARRSNVRSFTVTLPRGLSFRTRLVHRRREVSGLSLKGGRIKSETVRGGVLAITLKKAVSRVTVSVSAKGLSESRALRDAARSTSRHKRLKTLRLVIVARNSKGKRVTIHVTTRNLGL